MAECKINIEKETTKATIKDKTNITINVHNYFTTPDEKAKEFKREKEPDIVVKEVPKPNLIINRGTCLVELFGEMLIFTASQLRILCCLAERQGNYVPKSQLYAVSVDDHAEIGNNSALKSQMQKIRKKMDRHHLEHNIIQCYNGLGYRLNSNLTVQII